MNEGEAAIRDTILDINRRGYLIQSYRIVIVSLGLTLPKEIWNTDGTDQHLAGQRTVFVSLAFGIKLIELPC